MVFTDLLRAAVVLILLEFHSSDTIYLAYIVSFLSSLGTRIFVPAQSVLFRRVIPFDKIPKAQGTFRVASSLSLALGPALGGTLLLSLGPTSMVILDSFTFVVSMVFLLKIHQGNVGSGEPQESMSRFAISVFIRDIVQGMRFVIRTRTLVIVGIVTAVLTLVGFVWFSVDVFYVKYYLDSPGEWVGYLWASSGVGDLLAGLATFLIATRVKSLWLMIVGLFIRAVSLISYSLIGHFDLALLVCLSAGFGDGLTSTAISTLAMTYSPSSMQGRVSSTLDMVGQFSGIAATVLITGMSSDFTSQHDLFGCGMLLLFTSIFVAYWILYVEHQSVKKIQEPS